MNWLIVGAGDIVHKRVGPAIAAEPRSRIVAVCDVVQQHAEDTARQYDARAYTDLGEALQDGDVEAVYVATPVFLHVPLAVQALQAGKHALVEKPVGVSYAQACELVEAAQAADGTCGVSYYRRFYPRYEMAEQMLDAGEFGQVVLIRLHYFTWFGPTADDPKAWRLTFDKSGGGVLPDMGSHMFDVMIGLFGLPARVYGKVATQTHAMEVEDSAVMVMEYEDGPQVIASFNWNSKTWSHEFEIIGTEAKVKWHPYDGPTVLKTVGRDIQDLASPNQENIHYPVIEDFVSAVEEGRLPRVTAEEAAKTNLLLDAIYLSARENREVALSEIEH